MGHVFRRCVAYVALQKGKLLNLNNGLLPTYLSLLRGILERRLFVERAGWRRADEKTPQQTLCRLDGRVDCIRSFSFRHIFLSRELASAKKQGGWRLGGQFVKEKSY